MKKYHKHDEKIIRWQAMGLTQRKIADKLHISKQRVHVLIKRLNLPLRVPVVYSFTCKNCKKVFSSNLKRRIYCSRKCADESKKVHRSIAEQEAFLVKLREKVRVRANDYYHQVFKKRSDWRQITRERNKKYYPHKYAK